jgi:hypothetical protein
MNRFGGMSGLILTVVLVLGFVYFAWKQFSPSTSAGYPDVEDMDVMPSFVPRGNGPTYSPSLPFEQD